MSAQTLSRAVALTRVLGQSGHRYVVERILQDKPKNQGRVYLATVAPHDFKYFKDMFDDLRSSPYLHVADDACPDESVFVYKYLRDHFLCPAWNRYSHGKGIVHTDIKANNTLIEWKDQGGDITVEQVQVVGIEDAAYVPEDCVIKGRQVRNWMWRGPEAHASARVHTLSDMFSFGLVCIYAITKRVVLAADDEEIPEDIELLDIVLERQLSYFSDLEGIDAQLIAMVAADLNADNPRRPFALWQDIDPDFKDLAVQMMNVDPTRRLTANEALAHK
ncbi:hypothetical protein BU23DRAFT_592508 [Bimuria novae-zelandiae CBS 107.79]|uniref:Protein kinase domain-containing protein n=1 Tax=Bimuria novae-zelandiae CBS 107.79 TaxID=1447943 RepID=A0A6A5UR58_9PLEO|nr:hypothetical protein BU23DRAFT_592508 [Bimuria novae-zelandiae CBS 107.79]